MRSPPSDWLAEEKWDWGDSTVGMLRFARNASCLARLEHSTEFLLFRLQYSVIDPFLQFTGEKWDWSGSIVQTLRLGSKKRSSRLTWRRQNTGCRRLCSINPFRLQLFLNGIAITLLHTLETIVSHTQPRTRPDLDATTLRAVHTSKTIIIIVVTHHHHVQGPIWFQSTKRKQLFTIDWLHCSITAFCLLRHISSI